MNIFLITSVYCLFNFSLAQETLIDEDKSGKVHLYLNVNPNFNYYLKFPDNYIICFEGCNKLDDRPALGLSVDLGLTYSFNEKHSLIAGIGFTHYNLHIKLKDLFSNIIYETKDELSFLSIVAGHSVKYNKWQFESVANVDHNIQDYFRFKDWNLSYRAAFNRILVDDRFRLSAGPYIKMAVLNYWRKDDEFLPISFGVQLSARL